MASRLHDLLDDMLRAALQIQEFVGDSSEAPYLASSLLQSAVKHQFTVIGEVASRLGQFHQQFLDDNPVLQWRLMADFRNFVVHEYDDVDERVVWQSIISDLPPIIAALPKLMEAARFNRL
jgi:uncharacterized protein with HEPN domain